MLIFISNYYYLMPSPMIFKICVYPLKGKSSGQKRIRTITDRI